MSGRSRPALDENEEMTVKTSTEKMIARKDGAIGWMLFNNPARHNAVSVEMWKAVPEILEEFGRDEKIRVVVLAGVGGKAFVSGADISEFGEKRHSREATLAYNATVERASDTLLACKKPTIAMIQGYCIGGGLAISLCCDLRIASRGFALRRAGREARPRLCLSGHRAPRRRGRAFLRQGDFLHRAPIRCRPRRSQMGLVNRVRPAAELESFVIGYAGMIGANAPLTVGAVKLCVTEYVKEPAKRDLAACQAAVDRCFASADYVEGRTAFMEKRKPVFRGV